MDTVVHCRGAGDRSAARLEVCAGRQWFTSTTRNAYSKTYPIASHVDMVRVLLRKHSTLDMGFESGPAKSGVSRLGTTVCPGSARLEAFP